MVGWLQRLSVGRGPLRPAIQSTVHPVSCPSSKCPVSLFAHGTGPASSQFLGRPLMGLGTPIRTDMTVQGRLLPCDSARCLTHPSIGWMDWFFLTMEAERKAKFRLQSADRKQHAGRSPRSTEGSSREVPSGYPRGAQGGGTHESKAHGPGGAEDKAMVGWQGQRQAWGHICPLGQGMG